MHYAIVCLLSILGLYMDATLKLVHINIERSKHLSLVFPFLKSEQPDVVCIIELMERDFARFEEELGMKGIYSPMALHPAEDNEGVTGSAVFSKYPLQNTSVEYYHHSAEPLLHHIPGHPDTIANALITAEVEKDSIVYRIATTHFIWSTQGEVTDLQRECLEKMLPMLEQKGELVLTGDFNAPRGGEIFAALASKFKDNVPAEYVSSLDPAIHRAGARLAEDAKAMGIPGYMVDGIFSTPSFTISNVKLVAGVSDHCSIVANVSKQN